MCTSGEQKKKHWKVGIILEFSIFRRKEDYFLRVSWDKEKRRRKLKLAFIDNLIWKSGWDVCGWNYLGNWIIQRESERGWKVVNFISLAHLTLGRDGTESFELNGKLEKIWKWFQFSNPLHSYRNLYGFPSDRSFLFFFALQHSLATYLSLLRMKRHPRVKEILMEGIKYFF